MRISAPEINRTPIPVCTNKKYGEARQRIDGMCAHGVAHSCPVSGHRIFYWCKRYWRTGLSLRCRRFSSGYEFFPYTAVGMVHGIVRTLGRRVWHISIAITVFLTQLVWVFSFLPTRTTLLALLSQRVLQWCGCCSAVCSRKVV